MKSNININDYNYDLPEERIAKFPLPQRDASKLLVYRDGQITESVFKNLPLQIEHGSLLVFNNTKVVHARIIFNKETGARIEVFCLEPETPSDYAQNFASTKSCNWKCSVGNLKKWKSETLQRQYVINGKSDVLTVEKISISENNLSLKFSWSSGVSFAQILETCGNVPIPPYLKRQSQDIDTERYQTVYSKFDGSVAAPTAGLHFTNEVFTNLRAKNIDTEEITLHVGAGTFKPVKTELVCEHEMHTEHFIVKKASLQNIIKHLQNITAVGTTSVRTLESLYWLGCKIAAEPNLDVLHVEQFEPYEFAHRQLSVSDALQSIINYMEKNDTTEIHASTQIMIMPSYKFKIIDRLVTNFHQPKSTLLLLIAAFIGDDWHKVYKFAMDNNFRFLSYGDSSLLFKNQ